MIFVFCRNLLRPQVQRASRLLICIPSTFLTPKIQTDLVRTARKMTTEINKDELKKRLTPVQWHVTQEKGTERPFTGCYNKSYDKGTYTCIVCDQELFSSETKYDSGCGWPAFNEVLDQGRVKLTKDTSNVGGNLLLLIANPDMVRTEVTCSKCGSHLGHVFNDGPKPTRKRFCINSASIMFHAAGEEKKSSS